jgi:hypothetical protein
MREVTRTLDFMTLNVTFHSKESIHQELSMAISTNVDLVRAIE